MTSPNSDTTTPLAPRKAALALIDAAFVQRGGIDNTLGDALAGLEGRDRAFARSLAMTTLRRWGQIERLLADRVKSPPPVPVVALMRIGLAQALFMDVPDHAAVATTLDLAQTDNATRPFKGLINAVLRGILRDQPPIRPADLAPDWLYARWRSAYGQAAADAIAAVIAEEPLTDVTLKPDASAEAVAAELDAAILPGGTLRSRLRGDISGWPGYEGGEWWVQDAAAAIPTRLLNLQPGERALDLCAAPGGKTLQMAAAGAQVTAVDRSASRLKRLRENLVRTELSVEIVPQPAETWEDTRTFDAVLLDAPCSATGTFRRQPEVLWLVRPPEIAKLSVVQSRLLDAAAAKTRPGGRLIYCVCSLEPEEGEAQASAFLKRHPDFTRVPVSPGEAGTPEASITADGALRLLPHQMEGGMDGFYAARFVRTA